MLDKNLGKTLKYKTSNTNWSLFYELSLTKKYLYFYIKSKVAQIKKKMLGQQNLLNIIYLNK